MEIKVILDNIVNFQGDCIVNAANCTLLGGGGVDGAIHYAAGPELLKECRTLNGCATGQAKITKGYNLPAKYVIHTVGPVYGQHNRLENEVLLTRCYWNTLNLAKENNIHSIAFPAISTGAYGYPIVDATYIATATVTDWLIKNDYDIDVTFVCFNEEDYEIYNSCVNDN